jgi:hypothetical protein
MDRRAHKALPWFAALAVAAVLAAAGMFPAAGMVAVPIPATADDSGWPRSLETSSGSFVIYQPQPDELNGDVLTGRAAFSLLKSGETYPVFGVLWFTEQISVDRDSSTVTARNFDVTKVRLPGITPAQAGQYEKLVEAEATSWDLSGSVEELQAGLAAAAKERESTYGIDNAPPKIIFHDHRAILVVYDGAPVLEPIEGSKLQYVANTPYAVIFDPGSRTYYLSGANLWYQATDPLGPWADITDPPPAVRDAVPPDTSASAQITGPRPDVLTATEPTELIATDGPAQYAPLVEDELLYLANTESDVIREINTQLLYVLISGRWFRAPSPDGPWTFVRGDALPASFRRIPPDSPKGNVLASIAGTDEAEDAIADAQIPQTSAIRRDDTTFRVTYDGDPQFAPIEGTDLQYAMNSDAEVILADGRYYACDQGVWYVSDSPDGPWRVSETRPLGVEDIPPSCPVYDVRYVYIYDYTPDVVYVGYLPGYLGCYPYYGTVYYGTGYQYRSWRSRHHFIPRRFTWGFQARYNPWLSRWSFGFSYSTGFLRGHTRNRQTVDQRRIQSNWFGPGGYRRPLIGKDLALMRTRPRTRVQSPTPDRPPANVYNRPENIARVDRSVVRIPVTSIPHPIARPAPTPNNVFAGKDGKVYRRDEKGSWQVREKDAWKPTKLPNPPPETPSSRSRGPAERPAPRPEQPAPRPAQPDVRVNPDVRPRPEPPPAQRPAPPSKPTPPPSSRTPGDLEREFRARERSVPEKKPDPPPAPPPPPPQRSDPPSRRPPDQSKGPDQPKSPDQSKPPDQQRGPDPPKAKYQPPEGSSQTPPPGWKH